MHDTLFAFTAGSKASQGFKDFNVTAFVQNFDGGA